MSDRPRTRPEPLWPNVMIVARREYVERVRSRLFAISTLMLAVLAVGVAFTPVILRAADEGSVTRIAVVAEDEQLAERTATIIGAVLNGGFAGPGSDDSAQYILSQSADRSSGMAAIREGEIDAVLVANREPSGQITFEFLAGETVGADRAQLVAVGALAVAMLDWTADQDLDRDQPFVVPTFDAVAAAAPSARGGGEPISGSEYAGRRIVGIVFVVLIFITLVIYGMWVAAGVVAEKSSRVMELLVSAASARQLVLGKVLGIGLAGVTQYVGVLLPAMVALLIQDRVGEALLGPSTTPSPSLAALSPQLLAAFMAFFVLGFTLYALIYAAAGSLVSRPEDLQVIALPLSLIAIVGYLMALLALTGGTAGFIRFASYVPFWSPFVMITRLSIGRVETWELALSLGLLLVTIPIVMVMAVRIYAAGVLLYGQRPGFRQFLAAAVGRL